MHVILFGILFFILYQGAVESINGVFNQYPLWFSFKNVIKLKNII